jgi:hypothetical protein
LIDERRRLKSAVDAVERIARRQKSGHLTVDMDAGAMLLGMIALSWFPVAFPQLTRLITGRSTEDESFISKHRQFLKSVAVAFRGKNRNGAGVEKIGECPDKGRKASRARLLTARSR